MTTKSFGRYTAPLLKLRHEDTPRGARDFKRRYPREFEALKGASGGRDFTPDVLESMRESLVSPVEWVIINDRYDPRVAARIVRSSMAMVPAEHRGEIARHAERMEGTTPICDEPNSVAKLCVDYDVLDLTGREEQLLDSLSQSAFASGHPAEGPPVTGRRLFCVGWVRYCDNHRGTWLVEEVQTDLKGMRRRLRDPASLHQLEAHGIDPSEIEDILDKLAPWEDVFFEDAMGILLERAAEAGVAVEMLDYSTKRDEESPRSVYTDLPRTMGMKLDEGSEFGVEKTWKLTPNGYSFEGDCPGLPTWWIEWITDSSVEGYDDTVDWEEIEADLEYDVDFRALMEEWDPPPNEDYHVSYYRTVSPLGVPIVVIQHSGIEHVWADGSLDLEEEEAEAERRGFWYLT